MPRLELLGAQLAEPAALEDGVGEPLVHLPRYVPNTIPSRTGQVVREGEAAAPAMMVERIGPKSAIVRWKDMRLELLF